jgi:hypothetical protein
VGLAIVNAAEVAIVTILGAALQPEHFELYLGIGFGIAITLAMVFFDSPRSTSSVGVREP